MTDDPTQAEANELCTAASVVFFALLRSEATATGSVIALPELLCPAEALPPMVAFDPAIVEEATAMLIRMGVVDRLPDGSLGIQLRRDR